MASPSPAPTNHDDGLPSFYDNPLLSDVELKFSGNSIHAHKYALSARSLYFLKAFTGRFVEAKAKVMDLGNEDDPECVKNMLKYMYGENIPSLQYPAKEEAKDILLHNTRLFALADKYDIPSLRESITDHFEDHSSCWCIDGCDLWSPEIIKALVEAFDHVGDPQLKDCMETFCEEYIVRLMEDPVFEDMLERHPSLSVRLLSATAEKIRTAKKVWMCWACTNNCKAKAGTCDTVGCVYKDSNLSKTTLLRGH